MRKVLFKLIIPVQLVLMGHSIAAVTAEVPDFFNEENLKPLYQGIDSANLQSYSGNSLLESQISAIQIHNTLNETLYAALFYKTGLGLKKWGKPRAVCPIKPHMGLKLSYPKKNSYEMILCISRAENRHVLAQDAIAEETPHIHQFSCGLSSLDWYFTHHFDILFDVVAPDHLQILPVGSGLLPRINLLTKAAGEREAALIKQFEQFLIAASEQSLPSGGAVIRGRDNLEREKQYMKKRSGLVREAINGLFGFELLGKNDQPPTIALAFTGGGYRSMISTNGTLAAAANNEGGNLYDCLSYIMGCSGSSWAAATLAASGLHPCEHCSLQREKVGRGGLNTLISDLINKSHGYLERRFIETRYGHYHGPVGVYGHALGAALLDGLKINDKGAHHITFSDIQERLAEASCPLPVCVAIDPGKEQKDRIWYEFSPFYCGTHEAGGCWIDAALKGCTFKNGCPVHRSPEHPLPYLMGIWGSAFAVTPEEIAQESKVMSWLARILPGVGLGLANAYRLMFWGEPMQETDQTSQRAAVRPLPNFWYGIDGLPDRLCGSNKLYLVDGAIAMEGGYRHNFATIPALTRGVDILIMCDNPHDPKTDRECKHLRAAELEARRLGLPFPHIFTSDTHAATVKTMQNDVCSVFIEDGAPIVIYIKTKRNKKYDEELKGHKDAKMRVAGFDPDETVAKFTTTSNFHYTPEQYDLLSGLTKSIFRQCKPAIKGAIKSAVHRREAAAAV